MRTIIDESLPSRRIANGQSIGVLEGLASDDSDPTDFVVGSSGAALARYANLFSDDYWATGAASFGDLADAQLVAPQAKHPTHRLRVQLGGPPSQTVPITGQQQAEVAAELQQKFGSRATVFFNSNSPVIKSRPGSGIYFFEVDVALGSDVDPSGAASSAHRLLTEKQALFGPGMRILATTFEALGSATAQVATSFLRKVWKPAAIVGAVALTIYLLPVIVGVLKARNRRSSGRARRYARRRSR